VDRLIACWKIPANKHPVFFPLRFDLNLPPTSYLLPPTFSFSKYALSYIFIYSILLSKIELVEIAQHYGFLLTVLIKDELVNPKPKSGNYIINLESSTSGSGTHWMSMKVSNKQYFYQDSFGIIPPREVFDFCKRISNSCLAYSEIQMQNINTETCGFYSIGLLIHINRTKNEDIYKSAGEYINQFSSDSNKNNMILKNCFRDLPESKGL
jgi:hypothetical protein